MGRKPAGEVLLYRGDRYTWSVKGYWRCTSSTSRHNLTHRIWEEYHGKVPKGHMVFYKDGNRFNVAPENLVCMTQAEAQSKRLQRTDYKQLMRCYGIYGLLMNRIQEQIDPEKKRKRYKKIWEARRRRYGESGGN